MQDDVKKALEWLRKLRDGARNVWEPNHPTRRQRFLDVSPDEVETILAHIDGEPARLAAAVARERATPLTATPLTDRIAELEVQRDVRQRYGDRMKDERDAALARVKELKTALHLEREAHERALREVLDPVVRAKMMEPPPPLLLAPDVAALVAERDDLKAQLAEAMGVLRYLVEFIAAGGTPDDEDLAKARAFLAKYPEGR